MLLYRKSEALVPAVTGARNTCGKQSKFSRVFAHKYLAGVQSQGMSPHLDTVSHCCAVYLSHVYLSSCTAVLILRCVFSCCFSFSFSFLRGVTLCKNVVEEN